MTLNSPPTNGREIRGDDTTVDYTLLFEPTIPRLSLVPARDNRYIVWDEHHRYYILVPSSLETCLRFMKAMADKGHATLDDASVERVTWESTEFSVRVPDVPTNVIPIGRKAG